MQIVDITRQTQLENQISAMEIRMSQNQEQSYQLMRDELEQLQRQIISVENKNAKDIQSVKENITAELEAKLEVTLAPIREKLESAEKINAQGN